jgi:micrococcal nuclease
LRVFAVAAVWGALATHAAWGQARAPVATDEAAAPPATVYAARVTRVFDGDTLWVKPMQGGRYRKLRLDGIDAPEICQSGGTTSRDALAARVLNQVVEVCVRQHDDYGRGIARLRHQGDDIAAWMVAHGQAWSYRWRRSLGPFKDEEAQARRARKGLFAEAGAELPREFRQRHGPCPLP